MHSIPPLFSIDAQVSDHLHAFTPSAPRRIRMYFSSFAPVANPHIWPNRSRPILGVRILSLPTMDLRNCIPFLNGARAASQTGRWESKIGTEQNGDRNAEAAAQGAVGACTPLCSFSDEGER